MTNISLGRLAILLAAIGGSIGSGWLLGSLHVAEIAGPAGIFSWPIGGMLMMFIGYTFVILTRSLPISGGTVGFLQLTHGEFVGFSFSWVAWVAWVAVAPNEILAMLQYATNYVPSLMNQVNGQQTLTHQGLEVAIVLMVLIYFINIKGLKWLSHTNFVIVTFKLFVPFATFLILLMVAFHIKNFHTIHGFAPFGLKGVLQALPTAGVIYSFIGFNPVIQMASEIKNPKKSVGFAIIGSTLFCIFLYTLLQIIFIGSISPTSFNQGWHKINFPGDAGPFAGLIMAIGFSWFAKLLYLDAAISPFGTALIQASATSRLTYGMAKNHYLPEFLIRVNRQQSPANAAAFNILIGLLFFLPFPSWQQMMSFLTTCIVVGYVVGPMSLVTLKHAMPEKISPYSKRQIEILSLFGFYVCNLIIFWTGWHTLSKIMIIFAVGYLLLFIYKMFNHQNWPLNLNRGWWVLPYLLGMGLLSLLSSYGHGDNIIPFGWDFVMIGIFTLIIFYLAVYLSTRKKEKVLILFFRIKVGLA